MDRRRTHTGTAGSNQYTKSQAGSLIKGPGGRATAKSPANNTLLTQLSDRPPQHYRCGEVWGTGCPAVVGPPTWIHTQDHPTADHQSSAAGDESTPPEILEYLSRHEEHSVRLLVAGNRSCPPAILEQFSYDEDVRWLVVRHPACPLVVLRRVSHDPHSDVRWGVAANLTSTPDMLEEFSHDRDFQVRWRAAQNPASLPATLVSLLADENPNVARAAAANPSLPRPLLAMWQLAHS
jgi:hypothetical protein